MRHLPQTLHLRGHVHAAQVDECVLLLDTAADRYLALPGDGVTVLADGRSLAAGDATLAQDLIVAALVSASPDPAARDPRRDAPRPTATWVRLDYPRPQWRDAAPAARATLDLLLGYRGRTLGQILAATPPSGPSGTTPDGGLRELVDGFQRWIPFAPVSAKCLLRSFMLLRHLRRHGRDAVWVFGVSTWPFRAHCWLQAGDVVLDDDLERIRAFTPILVR